MKGSRPKKKRINPIDVVMMTIFGCVTSAVGAIVALAIPVTVVAFILIPLVPSTATWVESYACDPGGVVEIEHWTDYDPIQELDESGTEFLCVYEDGTWTESSTEILVSMILLGILIPGAIAGAFGAFLGLISGLSPNERAKKKKKKKTQPNQAKRAATPEEDVESENAQVSSNDADSETS